MRDFLSYDIDDLVSFCIDELRDDDGTFPYDKEIFSCLTVRDFLNDLFLIRHLSRYLLTSRSISFDVHYYSIIYFIEFYERFVQANSYKLIDHSVLDLITYFRKSIEFITLKNYFKEIEIL